MTTTYPLKVQAIRSKGVKVRLYVNIPIPLAELPPICEQCRV
ncbi:MAG: hypothetical protein M5U15_04500 [Kiritimatiellae bacterium]|nr:hypothetical protein [Kiritimatiellia bacterium]